jgi:hypothetical protein
LACGRDFSFETYCSHNADPVFHGGVAIVAQWNKVDLSKPEEDFNLLIDKYMEENPHIELPVMVAALTNCLLMLMKDAPSWVWIITQGAFSKGKKIILEKSVDS